MFLHLLRPLCNSAMTNPVEELGIQIQASLSIIHSHSSTNDARTAAQVTLDSLIIGTNSPLIIPACLHLLQGGGDSVGCHFALSTISKFIKERSSVMSQAEWSGLMSGALALFQGSVNLPFFVMSKLIDVICEVAIRVWPNNWPELLPATLSGNTAWGICLFARICDSLSEDSLSARCIAPERQMSLRIGFATVVDRLAATCLEFVKTPAGSAQPQLQWVIELINGLCVATKQSSFLIRFGLHEIVFQAFVSCSDPAVKMLCVETLSNFIHFLSGQSGRSYTIDRARRDQELEMLERIISTCHNLLQPNMIQAYCEQDELRDCLKAFFDLLTDIRKTSNIFSYFSSLDGFANVLIDSALLHPSVNIQISALGNIDALLRSKNIVADRRVFLLCFLACHDFYTSTNLESPPLPPAGMLSGFANKTELVRRRDLCAEECEEEDTKPNEVVGKLKNVALLCVRHITSASSTGLTFIDFLREILSETIKPGLGVSSSYYASLLFTEAVATTLTSNDPKRPAISSIVDVVASSCPPDHEQDYLWFLGKTGFLVSAGFLQSVFRTLLSMDIANRFPVQVAFISLCKNNPHSGQFVTALHQALETALGGESRSWAIGAILSASSHGGVGAADGYAMNVYNDAKLRLEAIAGSNPENLEDFAKRSTPVFATLKAVLDVPLSSTVAYPIAKELSLTILPFYWTRLMRSPGVFDVGPNEYLSVLGQQFIQSSNSATNSQVNACFQLYLSLTQVTGACLPHLDGDDDQPIQAMAALFDPQWNLRPSLLNILVSNVATSGARTAPRVILKSMLPPAIEALGRCIRTNPTDDFTVSSISRASGAVVQCLLNALEIVTDDEVAVSEYSGSPKPVLTQKQLKAQLRSRNRFSVIAEGTSQSAGKETYGPKIPYDLLTCPELALSIVCSCLNFKTDKSLRRIFQSVPTIITRWWNSISHDSALAIRFLNCLGHFVLAPILSVLDMVRRRAACCQPGGQLYSYTCKRAVSGRKLASELVDHATISVHGILSVMWRFAVGHVHSSQADPLTVVASSVQLSQAVKMILDAHRISVTDESVGRLASCAKEQSLESRAALKFIVEGVTRDDSASDKPLPRSNSNGSIAVIPATSKDLESPISRAQSASTDLHS